MGSSRDTKDRPSRRSSADLPVPVSVVSVRGVALGRAALNFTRRHGYTSRSGFRCSNKREDTPRRHGVALTFLLAGRERGGRGDRKSVTPPPAVGSHGAAGWIADRITICLAIYVLFYLGGVFVRFFSIIATPNLK